MTEAECPTVHVPAPRTYYYGQTPQNPSMDFVGFGATEKRPAEEIIYQTRATDEGQNAEP
jgi:hypothetical protein